MLERLLYVADVDCSALKPGEMKLKDALKRSQTGVTINDMHMTFWKIRST